MKIAEFDIFRYRLALKRPLVLRGQTLEIREGLLISVADEHGHTGWGEIAPLPGFNQESLQAALKAAGDLRFAVKNTTIPDHLEELSGGFANWLGPHKLPSSVQCGVESALLNLIAHSRDLTVARLISDSPLGSHSGKRINQRPTR